MPRRQRTRFGQKGEIAILMINLLLTAVLLIAVFLPLNLDRLPVRFQAPPPPPPKRSGFDYFLLALRWPNAFCNIQRQGTLCFPKPRFTVHGLWPQLNNGETLEYCPHQNPMTTEILSPFREKLLDYWPNLLRPSPPSSDRLRGFREDEIRFWVTQWDKHGSCSSEELGPEKYISSTIKLAERFARRIGSKMATAGINPDGTTNHSYVDILYAVKDATDHDAKLHFGFNSTGHRLLREVRLCVKKDAVTLFDCDPSPSIFASRH